MQPRRLVVGAAAIIVIGAFANLLGWDIRGWFSELWDTITQISGEYLVAAVVLKTVQTAATAYGWYSILRFAYGDRVRWREIFACYAASVALNGILPANLGTLAMLLMFTTIIAGATFAAILGGYAVEKVFFTISGLFVYLYLFLTVEGSFDVKFEFVHTHTAATVIMLAGGAYILYVLARRAWPRVLRWWEDAKEGGGILVHPRAYLWRVFVPELVGWIASLAVIGVFLAAYGIPVTFQTLMRICGGNSIANVTSVTPGGAGVTQAFNVAIPEAGLPRLLFGVFLFVLLLNTLAAEPDRIRVLRSALVIFGCAFTLMADAATEEDQMIPPERFRRAIS